MKMRVTDPADIRYVAANFQTLERLCERTATTDRERVERDIERRRIPGPSYTVEDGTPYFPADYFQEQPTQAEFAMRLTHAAQERGLVLSQADVCEMWDAYLDGTYGMCLRHVSPETIVEKQFLLGDIEELTQAPSPQDPQWTGRLRERVNRLDELERPFTAFDRIFFGRPVSRDLWITAVHEKFPECFPAERIYHRWHDAARDRDLEELIALYTDDCRFESPLVPILLPGTPPVCQGKAELDAFFRIALQRRPDDLVRWYREGRPHFDGVVLSWEYPREIPGGEQIDIAEFMTLRSGRIAHHRVYWGWYSYREAAAAN